MGSRLPCGTKPSTRQGRTLHVPKTLRQNTQNKTAERSWWGSGAHQERWGKCNHTSHYTRASWLWTGPKTMERDGSRICDVTKNTFSNAMEHL